MQIDSDTAHLSHPEVAAKQSFDRMQRPEAHESAESPARHASLLCNCDNGYIVYRVIRIHVYGMQVLLRIQRAVL